MSKEINILPEQIRAAGRKISGLSIEETAIDKLPMSEGNSDGLAAEEINKIVSKLGTIGGLLEDILEELPKKLEEVAVLVEKADTRAARKFR